MELLIAAGIAATLGCVVGMLAEGRHSVRERERAYLYGHVDGYAKAVRDEL